MKSAVLLSSVEIVEAVLTVTLRMTWAKTKGARALSARAVQVGVAWLEN